MFTPSLIPPATPICTCVAAARAAQDQSHIHTLHTQYQTGTPAFNTATVTLRSLAHRRRSAMALLSTIRSTIQRLSARHPVIASSRPTLPSSSTATTRQRRFYPPALLLSGAMHTPAVEQSALLPHRQRRRQQQQRQRQRPPLRPPLSVMRTTHTTTLSILMGMESNTRYCVDSI